MSDYCVKNSVKSDNHALHNLSSNPTDKVSEFDNSSCEIISIVSNPVIISIQGELKQGDFVCCRDNLL